MEFITGGVCAPKGIRAAGVHCGIRKGKVKKDLALIVSDVSANAAAVYTTNIVKAAPITVTQQHLADGRARAVICNSGIANACVSDGIEKARAMCKLTADALGISAQDVLVASTGVIGQSLDLQPIQTGVSMLTAQLSTNGGTDAAQAIMTTDTVIKECAVRVDIGGKSVCIGAAAKGSGMMNPRLATMLSFITTDARIESSTLHTLLTDAANLSINRVSIDGDTSTNDMLIILANGESGVQVDKNPEHLSAFTQALNAVCVHLAKLLAKDGEGATKLIECTVSGAQDRRAAEKAADSIINSPLVKSAMFGQDANWGRILCAAGYSGAQFNPDKVSISLRSSAGEIAVCANGAGLNFCEKKALQILQCNEIIIDINLHSGNACASAWGCDLSYEYVKINGDYRT
ncbi:MAG: bifunctional glutamate N-acetyltransferase/amino-acid acetyltransferase ArgJ [Firmicutes bacterium]|nr:bifunctional glutamate N-acetyltransferase/amino-acid acetyltransferase ArgJ [Bacillota bacterium]